MAQRISKKKGAIMSQSPNIITIPPIFINYDRSVEEGNSAGNYGFVKEDIISKNFPININRRKSGIFEIKLVHFGYLMEPDEPLVEIKKLHLRPAELPELQVIGEHHPDFQQESPIAAIGSKWWHSRKDCGIPYLHIDDAKGRILNLNWVSKWPGYWYFAAMSADVNP